MMLSVPRFLLAIIIIGCLMYHFSETNHQLDEFQRFINNDLSTNYI